MDLKGNKGFRMIYIYERLNKGELIIKEQLADELCVTPKTIQRDIDELRIYLAETHSMEEDVLIKYDRRKKGYYLIRFEREWFTNKEILALCKILLESRAFNKDDLHKLINKLLMQVVPKDKKYINEIIQNEYRNYIPLRHNKELLNPLWELSQFIIEKEIIRFDYTRKDGNGKERIVKPISIMFSEYYFYLIAFENNDSEEDKFKIFRVDRIENITKVNQKFKQPYNKRFNDGEFRKRIQFMYTGNLEEIKFKCKKHSLEAVLDRLPTAEIINEENGVYTIKAEAYGEGIDMWIRSQGENIEFLSKRIIDGGR